MTPLARQVFTLIASVMLVLLILGVLLWGREVATAPYVERSSEFIDPSRTRLARAQRTLAALRSSLYRYDVSSESHPAVPSRFDVIGALDNIDISLLHVIRLARAFDAGQVYGLPSRAHRQLETARRELSQLDAFTPRNAARTLTILEPLQDTLDQLERIFELEHQRTLDEERRVAARSLHLVALAASLLILITVPLIIRLAFRLRNTIRQETKTRKDLEEAKRDLEALVMYDGLTGLGNRHLFKDRLDQVASRARRTSQLAAVMYVDLDNFKRINDSLGHDAGDEVLKIMGARLKDSVRASDTVARLGGDEFTVIIHDMVGVENAATVAEHLLRRINEPIRLAGTELVMSASIGISIMPTDGCEPSALMKNADMALYRAKERGRHDYQFFVEEMNRAMVAQMEMESALRAAIRDDEFLLHYQPEVDLVSGRVTMIEALLRWRPASGQLIPPAEFIPLAEASGLLKEIGGWVLLTACEDLARLRREVAPDLRVSINLSARQFREPGLVERIRQALDRSALPPTALEIEITETTLIEDIDTTIKTVETLRDLGVTIAIDDFGIGYSSLNYLKHLPIDTLKVDRSFVRDIETDEADRNIVDGVLALGKSLSLRIVAEGIETRWQFEYLAARGCNVGQGFLFSRPVPVDELFRGGNDHEGNTPPEPGSQPRLYLVD